MGFNKFSTRIITSEIHSKLGIFFAKNAKKCALSERHPGKQGLKLQRRNALFVPIDFQSDIQENKD